MMIPDNAGYYHAAYVAAVLSMGSMRARSGGGGDVDVRRAGRG